MAGGQVEYVAAESLFVSEPDARGFGNPPNSKNDPSWSNANWLKSRFHFSFAEYYDPRRAQFGVLRVVNDDLVQPQRGFGAHPHRDMEIVTYVVEGELTHQDSMGQKETLGKGSIQFMTAGQGVYHSEHNMGHVPLRFIQIWITPRQKGLRPNYGSYNGLRASYHSGWTHLVSDVQGPALTPVKINQDANIFVIETSSPQTVNIAAGRQAYMLCVSGYATVGMATGQQPMKQHDALRIYGPLSLAVVPQGHAHLLLLEMAQI